MNRQALEETANAMVAPGRGILAMDESHPTCARRFDSIGVDCNEDSRRAYRGLLVTAPGAAEHLSGYILFDETLRQSTDAGDRFPDVIESSGSIPGIKVDTGTVDMPLHPGEKYTRGLDGLNERLIEYRDLGARFAKWRAVITIGDGIPSSACIDANTWALAMYASFCQDAGIVPIVEPEILMDGAHDIETCDFASRATLNALFSALYRQSVHIEGTVLKASMVLSGPDCPVQASDEEIAEKTIDCLRDMVPAALPGVVFLSGGQTALQSTVRLNAMNASGADLPWRLSFSYGRALQDPALRAWNGSAENAVEAQRQLALRARANGAATLGEYSPSMEEAA
ncbi:MAG: fructose-bisphosphate aldolase class I [Gammaproteobacteria bacterium]|nr:fructose-bisphosphate aldolase class I [Gammaproteobacteria bacterium]